MSRLSRAIKEEITKEILKGFKLKTPGEFAEEIRDIAVRMMTQEERDILKKLNEYKMTYSLSLHEFNLYSESRYLSGYRLVIPHRMAAYDSEFRNAVREVCDQADEVQKDKQKLIDMVNSCATIKSLRKNLPQFVEQIDAVLGRTTANALTVTFDTSFLDKYKETK